MQGGSAVASQAGSAFRLTGRARLRATAAFRKTKRARSVARSDPSSGAPATQFNSGSIISAKLVRARCSRLFTVPRFTPVMSAISS
jgi:hypothetical protein